MASTSGRSQTRFDRRKVEIPQANEEFGPVGAVSRSRRTGRWGVLFYSTIILGLAGALAYGYLEYERQNQELNRLQAQLDSAVNSGAAEREALGNNLDPLVGTGKTTKLNPLRERQLVDERDAAMSSLELARQRIAALQAELGVPANGRPDLQEIATIDSEFGAEERIEALMLEVRLLARERDAARQQIDAMLAQSQTTQSVLKPMEPAATDALREENALLGEQRSALEAELQRLKQRNRSLEHDIESQSQLTQDSTVLIDELNARLEADQTELSSTTQQLEDLQNDLSNLKDRHGLLNSELEQTREALSQTKSERDKLSAKLEVLKPSEGGNDEIEAANGRIRDLEEKLALVSDERDKAKQTLAAMESELGVIKRNSYAQESGPGRLQELEEALAKANARIVALETIDRSREPHRDDDMERELVELRDRLRLMENFAGRFVPDPPLPAPR